MKTSDNMITSKDIRVGSIISQQISEKDNLWEHKSISTNDIIWCDEKPGNFNKRNVPISLTPEMLLKDLGFEPGYEKNVFRRKLPNGNTFTLVKYGNEYDWEVCSWAECHLKYLHELQNIFWDLVKVEVAL